MKESVLRQNDKVHSSAVMETGDVSFVSLLLELGYAFVGKGAWFTIERSRLCITNTVI